MDIRLVLTRVSIFAVVYIFVLGLPFALGLGLKSWFSAVIGGGWWLIPPGDNGWISCHRAICLYPLG